MTTIGPEDYNKTTMGHAWRPEWVPGFHSAHHCAMDPQFKSWGPQYENQGPQWVPATTTGPGDTEESRGPQWVSGTTL